PDSRYLDQASVIRLSRSVSCLLLGDLDSGGSRIQPAGSRAPIVTRPAVIMCYEGDAAAKVVHARTFPVQEEGPFCDVRVLLRPDNGLVDKVFYLYLVCTGCHGIIIDHIKILATHQAKPYERWKYGFSKYSFHVRFHFSG